MKNENTKRILACLAAGLAAVALAGEAGTNQVSKSNVKATVGGDVRLRYDITQGLPTDQHAEAPHSDYMRLRVRPWMNVHAGDLGIYVRLADEFRYYRRPESNSRKQQFPDVVFLDNLYLEYKNLFDAFDVKVGRQDMAFGSKRVISDGTGGDGSRSASFDGARVTWHAAEKRTLDAFAVSCAREDWLPTLGKEHANGKKPAAYDMTGYNQAEEGAGLYWQDRSNKDFGYDVYYVAKREDRGTRAKYYKEGDHPDTHTAGVRLLPKFTDTLSGEFEGAVQVGSESLLAGQAYGGVTYAPKASWKPYLTGACWYLSGDSAGGRGNNAWHAVFNRETGMGEAVAPMYTKYDYTNLLYPHLAAGVQLADACAIDAECGPMFTPVTEANPKGGDYGDYRGFYGKVKYTIPLGKVVGSWAHGGKLAFTGEWLQKGNYFVNNDRNAALFGRAELSWAF